MEGKLDQVNLTVIETTLKINVVNSSNVEIVVV